MAEAFIDKKGHIYYQGFDFTIFTSYPYFDQLNTKILKCPNNADKITTKLLLLGFKDFIIYPVKDFNKKSTNFWIVRFKSEEQQINYITMFGESNG